MYIDIDTDIDIDIDIYIYREREIDIDICVYNMCIYILHRERENPCGPRKSTP